MPAWNSRSSSCSVIGASARDQVTGVQDITIKWDDAVGVFVAKQLGRWAFVVDASLPTARELAPDSYGALVSLVYNRGATFLKTGERYNEMRHQGPYG
jgi:hypothetical protein